MQLQLTQYQSYLSQIDATDTTQQSLAQQIQYTISSLESQLAPEGATEFGKQVLDKMVEEQLIQQEADARSITLSEDEITQEVEKSLGYDRNAATQVVTDTAPSMTAEEYKKTLDSFQTNILKTSGFSEKQYRALITTSLLKTKLQEALSVDVPKTADQVETILLTAGTLTETQALQERVNTNNEDPQKVLEELTADDNDQTSGFTMPWLPANYLEEQFGAELAQAAFNTPTGKASAVVAMASGSFYTAYIMGHEDKELNESLFQQAQEKKYDEWLQTQKENQVEYLDWEAAIVTQ